MVAHSSPKTGEEWGTQSLVAGRRIKEPQISPLRYAPVEMTNCLYKKNCHLDRSVPGFPASLRRIGPRVRLSLRKAA